METRFWLKMTAIVFKVLMMMLFCGGTDFSSVLLSSVRLGFEELQNLFNWKFIEQRKASEKATAAHLKSCIGNLKSVFFALSLLASALKGKINLQDPKRKLQLISFPGPLTCCFCIKPMNSSKGRQHQIALAVQWKEMP
ncbi:Hypothetical predicted protein [Podarcis lilfordi]|uniref:Uncharacterized protein n=1 Tax=Podarcis lilfordi TaxID=74358 RepID=A0AA35LED4_9SAUR|nr:Hypothetical predicted protein [Podarcis lilfordi]